ncbi:DUF2935 domain-containing protein [Desmospora profundinema]|uniref:DUF2935 domain-containing protein n=1 Tax=Desmospora profundinema TaxID=1571184 RepID=A0ABU1IRC1_9BACL|nr:DUF2935 domain-containing protein [Desmospora profundinema]MDR6227338.1 hypothetical protein [Desmospora profundinema]
MELRAWDEHHFWLEILEDHAQFVFEFLSPAEKKWVQAAKSYKQRFRALRQELQGIDRGAAVTSFEMIQFARRAQPVAAGYYQLETALQRLRIRNQIVITATPSYFNGTLLENEEYLRFLSHYVCGMEPPPLPLADLLELWLVDQLGHALLLINHLDPVEVQVAARADQFRAAFQALLLQNRTITGYLRSEPPGFPRQMKLAAQAAEQVTEFYFFVQYVVREFRNHQLMNKTTLRFLEHHFPEACYFLHKLSHYAPDITIPPDCLLTKPTKYPNPSGSSVAPTDEGLPSPGASS